jgi:DNA repair ATPase RecN
MDAPTSPIASMHSSTGITALTLAKAICAELKAIAASLAEERGLELHIEEINAMLQQCGQLFNAENGIVSQIHQGLQLFQKHAEQINNGQDLLNRLKSIQIEIKDLSNELESAAESNVFDPE